MKLKIKNILSLDVTNSEKKEKYYFTNLINQDKQ